MKIEKVTTRWVRVPLEKPVGWSIKTINWREHLFVEIESDEGHVGVGCCLQDISGKMAKAAMDELLVPMLLGRDPRDIEALWSDMYYLTVRAGRRGNMAHAISAIDIALWDHHGKLAGMPLHKLLGGYRTEIPCYASGGYYYPGEELFPQLRREVQSYVDKNYNGVKIRVGALDAATDAKRAELAREVLGPGRKLMLDATQGYRDVNSCLELCRLVEDLDIYFLEEPLPIDMVEAYRRLAEKTSIPLATGENGATRWEFNEFVKQGSLSYLQPDATSCGGISEWRKIATIAGANGVSVAPHYHWDVHTQLAAATPEVSILEKFEGTGVKVLDLLMDNPREVTDDGCLRPSDVPGVGIEWNPAQLDRYTIEQNVHTA
ncbi:mandelate racemase/muconate lactonizing enzyme family protein [Pseudonocardia nematodicida]|uniref:Mandelate racemase/muconate lactonizing enzyme family protein n=1 Tax=Pseudonocardia nematodicida TaxID=1206997 RepID=A0ABV1KDT4_9PSEU